MHLPAVQAIATLMKRQVTLVVSIQNIAEFWNSATRPARNNGLGFSIEEAQVELAKLEGFFEVVHETLASYFIWKSLLSAYRVSGVQVHDARLVAVMKDHGIRQILTFNTADFQRYSAVVPVHPDTLA